MRVQFLTRYGFDGPSSRYRSFQFVEPLRAAGLEVELSPLFGDGYVTDLYRGHAWGFGRVTWSLAQRLRALLRARDFDLLWIEKELLPWVPLDLEVLLGRLGIPYVVDYDDAVFHSYDQHPSKLIRALFWRKIDRVMASAKVVIAGNDYLAERARMAGARRVAILPTVINLDHYGQPCSRDAGPATVGWIGSPVTQGYLTPLAPVLAAYCQAFGAKVHLVGARPDFRLPGVDMAVLPWSSETEVELINRFGIGIMPLQEDAWSRGKCGFKLIQYMGCSLPVVASPVGVNAEIVRHGVTGYLASTSDAWLEALRGLGESSQLRQEMGRAGRARVEENYSLASAWPKLINILFEASGRGEGV